jgi:hypothetical protein
VSRARNIKPGFFKNEDLADLDCHTRLLFIGLWTIADRAGRFENRPRKIKAEIFPYEQVNVESCMDQLCAKQFLTMYEVDGGQFVEIANWLRHQTPHHKEVDSVIPAPPQIKRQKKQQLAHAQSMDEPSMECSCAIENASCPTDSGFLIPDSGLLIPDSRASAKHERATRLPTDFQLTDERRLVAEAERLPAERTFAGFVDYWRAAAGAKARKLDWDATWRTWCRRAVDMKTGGGVPNGDRRNSTERDIDELLGR